MLSLVLVLATLLGAADAACATMADCNNRGQCIDGMCFCTGQFKGASCELSYCGEFLDPRANVGTGEIGTYIQCNLGGKCVTNPNNKEEYMCSCNKGFSGPNCSTYKLCTSSVDCSGQACNLVTGKCECPAGWDGQDCSSNSCHQGSDNPYGIYVKDCRGRGECVSTGGSVVKWTCKCRPGFFGYQCSEFMCNGNNPSMPDSDTSPCKYGSSCNEQVSPPVCICNTTFAGVDCGVSTCARKMDMHGNILSDCNGHGKCVEHSISITGYACQCYTGYVGPYCNISGCDNNPALCQHNGQCQAGMCFCKDQWQGLDCSFCPTGNIIVGDVCAPAVCFYENQLCSGIGLCIKNTETNTATCSCPPTHKLVNTNQCVLAACVTTISGVNGTRDVVCNNRGICGSDGVCACMAGFDGATCQENLCGSIVDVRFNEPAYGIPKVLPCYAGGSCIRSNVEGSTKWRCVCRPNFSGDKCEKFKCNDSRDCNGHGTCQMIEDKYSPIGSCRCSTGWDARDCTVNSCGVSPASFVDGELYCNGGGSCAQYASNTDAYMRQICECRTGFSGMTCETFVCSNNPAACNGGICYRDIDGLERCAVCPSLMSGRDCAADSCGRNNKNSPGTCFNRGTCVRGLTMYYCKCNPGYLGAECESAQCALPGESKPNDAIDCGVHGTCTKGEETNHCKCRDMYLGSYCNICAPGMERRIAIFDNDTTADLCAHPNCVANNLICNNHGVCYANKTDMTFSCLCDTDFVANGGDCVHKSCVTTYHDVNFFCGEGGKCVRDNATNTWACQCDDTSKRDARGMCFPTACYADSSAKYVCGGNGLCVFNRIDQVYVCNCINGYSLEGTNKCVRKLAGSSLTVAIVVPILCVLIVAGVLVWYFFSKRRLIAKYAKLNDDKLNLSTGGASSTL